MSRTGHRVADLAVFGLEEDEHQVPRQAGFHPRLASQKAREATVTYFPQKL